MRIMGQAMCSKNQIVKLSLVAFCSNQKHRLMPEQAQPIMISMIQNRFIKTIKPKLALGLAVSSKLNTAPKVIAPKNLDEQI